MHLLNPIDFTIKGTAYIDLNLPTNAGGDSLLVYLHFFKDENLLKACTQSLLSCLHLFKAGYTVTQCLLPLTAALKGTGPSQVQSW